MHICLLLVLIKGKLAMACKINAPIRYKMTWSESESRKFVNERWSRFFSNLTSFLVKQD